MHKSIIVLLGLLVILLSVGTGSLNNPNANAIADFDNKVDKKSVSVSSLNCNNINVNVNGLELDVFPPFLDDDDVAATVTEDNTDTSSVVVDNSDASEINNFRFICINNNSNTVIEEQISPSTASLTVKKQVFGCDNFLGPSIMECIFQNNSIEWLDCNSSNISSTIFCESLLESIFDIEVLNDQDNQIQQFEGSKEGTTIPNLEPGTYTVNEIKHNSTFDQLGEDPFAQQQCINQGFTDGGLLFNSTAIGGYVVCFEYEDEQGNDCSTITLAAGEERTCTVKNYIRFSNAPPPL